VRVLLVGTGVQTIPPSGYGGVERTIAELATALRAAGDEPIVLNRVRSGKSTDEYWFAWELPRLLRAERFDVVHASTPVVARRLAIGRIPFVYTSHSRHWFECVGLRQGWGLHLERRAVARATRAIALTTSLRRRMVSLVPSASSHLDVIPIGVDAEAFRPDWSRRNGTRVLGVGVVRPFKRWELAARALRGTGMQLRIAGPTPDPTYAQQVVSAGEGVELLGEVSETRLRELYAESDLLLHPSRVELLAGVVLQGLASGLPVLGAEPVSDLVQPEVDGAIAPAGAPDDAMVEFWNSWAVRLRDDPALRRTMGGSGRRSATERFSWSTVAAAHQALYRAVATRPVSPR
jgi:glycosyltransferase involved in cell wall biosynthesis